MNRKAQYYPAKTHCHICGLRIIDKIVSPHHPLYGTIDHLLPISMGGRDNAANRLPAHRWCNIRRGSQFVTDAMRMECRKQISAEIGRWVALQADCKGRRAFTRVDWSAIAVSMERLAAVWSSIAQKAASA